MARNQVGSRLRKKWLCLGLKLLQHSALSESHGQQMEHQGWMVARKLVGKSTGAFGINNKMLVDASWVRVRLPRKAGDSDKAGEGKMSRPQVLKLRNRVQM